MRRVHAALVGLAFISALLALAFLIRFGSALTLALDLTVPSAEAWLAPIFEQPVREDTTVSLGLGVLRADLYRPANPRGALLLVHGLSPAGRRHPELMRLARLLAEQRFLVLVPEFESLAAFRLTGDEIEQIRAALRYLRTLNASPGVAGFSFGAGPSLLAAAGLPGLCVVASFGGYADLRHVITYITTGVHVFEGKRYVQNPEPYNRWKLLALLVGFVEEPRDRHLLDEVARRKLANPAEDTSQIERQIGPEGRTILQIVRNRQEDAVDPLLARLPSRANEAMRRLSPMAAVPAISGRLVIAHGIGDESIPFTESLYLGAAAGGRARVTILHSFRHAGAPLPHAFYSTTVDAWNLIRVADDLLCAA